MRCPIFTVLAESSTYFRGVKKAAAVCTKAMHSTWENRKYKTFKVNNNL